MKKRAYTGMAAILWIASFLVPGLPAPAALAQEASEEVVPGEPAAGGDATGTALPEAIAEEEGSAFPLSLEMHGRVQAQLKAAGGDRSGLQDGYLPEHHGFSIPRWRLGLTSQVFEHVWIDVQIGETDNRRDHNVNVLDANIQLTYFDFANLILGAQKTPVGRNQMTSSKDLEFVERPLLATQLTVPTQTEDFPFVKNQNGLGLPERDVGMQLRGKIFEGILKYYLAMFNGTGEFFDDNWDGKFAYTARVVFNPFGDFSLAEGGFERDFRFGIGGTFFQNNVGNGRCIGYGADLDLRWYGASIRFEWMESRSSFSETVPVVDPILIREATYRGGWYVQAGYFVWPNYLQLVARFQQYDDNSHLRDLGDVTYTTVGANWYVRQNHDYKIQLNYTWREEKGRPLDNDALYLLAQVAF